MNSSLMVLFLIALIIPLKASAFQVEAFNRLKKEYDQTWSREKTTTENIWVDHKKEISQKWSEVKLPAVKTFVSYFDNLDSRLEIDFENGLIRVETLSIKKLTKNELIDIYSRGIKKNENLFANQLKADTLSSKFKDINSIPDEMKADDGQSRNHYSTSIALVPNHVKIRAKSFLPIVRSLARNHSLPIELILAIMWQESAFNPLARSHIPAFGLMQIVPRFAGNEVKEHLGDSSTVDGEFLYNPENNIRYGINYLSLLSRKYFSSIDSFEKRAPFVIAGYNWGPSRLLKHIEKGRIRISSQDSIISQIQSVAPAETKDYISKVFDKWKRIKNENWVNT